MKRCNRCNECFPLAEFYKNKGMKDGLLAQCKNCVKEYSNRDDVKRYRLDWKKEKYKRTGQTVATKMSLAKYRATEKFSETNRVMQRRTYSKLTEDQRRESRYIRRHGITLADYDEMFEKQNGECAICRLPEMGKRLVVDHDHETDKVRGLLCHRCNLFIGNIEENTTTLENAIKYLSLHNVESGQTEGQEIAL